MYIYIYIIYMCGGPEAEARWLRCPLARESGRGLNSSTAEQSAA